MEVLQAVCWFPTEEALPYRNWRPHPPLFCTLLIYRAQPTQNSDAVSQNWSRVGGNPDLVCSMDKRDADIFKIVASAALERACGR